LRVSDKGSCRLAAAGLNVGNKRAGFLSRLACRALPSGNVPGFPCFNRKRSHSFRAQCASRFRFQRVNLYKGGSGVLADAPFSSVTMAFLPLRLNLDGTQLILFTTLRFIESPRRFENGSVGETRGDSEGLRRFQRERGRWCSRSLACVTKSSWMWE
jgi:hypothetical protein